MLAEVDDIQFRLSRDAATRANLLMLNDPRIPQHYVNVFMPQGEWRLGLRFDEGVLALDADTVAIVQEIGRRAFKQILVENGHLLVGMILGEARESRNYFAVHHGGNG